MRVLFSVILTAVMAWGHTVDARTYRKIPARYQHGGYSSNTGFYWGFGVGFGGLSADYGYFGCSSPEIDEGMNYFSFDTGYRFSSHISLFSRMGLGFTSVGGHDISSGSFLLALRVDWWRLFVYAGGGTAILTADQYPDEYYGPDLELYSGVFTVGAGYVLLRKGSFRIELELGAEVSVVDEDEGMSGYSIGQFSAAFRW